MSSASVTASDPSAAAGGIIPERVAAPRRVEGFSLQWPPVIPNHAA